MLKRLKQLREECGLSQKALAEYVGVSQQSINKYENHSVEPDIETLIRIAQKLGTSVDYLIGATSWTENDNTILTLDDLDSEEINLISGYRTLEEEQRRSIRLIIENYQHLLKRRKEL